MAGENLIPANEFCSRLNIESFLHSISAGIWINRSNDH